MDRMNYFDDLFILEQPTWSSPQILSPNWKYSLEKKESISKFW